MFASSFCNDICKQVDFFLLRSIFLNIRIFYPRASITFTSHFINSSSVLYFSLATGVYVRVFVETRLGHFIYAFSFTVEAQFVL